ncbi:unnamed protein product [Rotaria sp. Silwood1]|nr:unnamed protein product [Rotaria sp. Silwood1]
MLVPFLSVSTAFVGVLSWLIRQQYRRVQQRNGARHRIQPYKSSSLSPTSKPDPLDHSLYWYPVAFSHEITCDQSRPFGFHLLNEPLCLYRTKDGRVVCVLDQCPHRSAPLSLGRITKAGNLECIYHGWQYGANGRCVHIPSASKDSNMASFVSARTRPIHEQYGFIWVWPGKSERAHMDLVPHRLFADVQNTNDKLLLTSENSCYLNIPYELMIDNALDIAHVDFIHDGTIGKRSQASCIRSEALTPSPYNLLNIESVSFKVEKYEQPSPLSSTAFSHVHFIPPCFVRLDHYGHKAGHLFVQIFFVLPSAQQKMRLMMQFYRNFANYKWIEYMPGYDYFSERLNDKIVNEDMLLLNGIHRNIAEMGAKTLGAMVSADGPIKAFRQYHSRVLTKFETIYKYEQKQT